MKRLAAGLFFSTLLATGGPVLAQTSPGGTDAILVFDASGSMWGQIDGVNKIVIARDVVGNLLNEMPASQRLGLVAYGHNRKGDCGDIEMLAPVGTAHGTIAGLVQGINPKGMTPMTDAVIQAAEALKYTENRATVILVSDGEETCHADPCNAARRLAELGVELTVHTVGFGLESTEARAATQQLQCIAEETGGRFYTAANAQELRSALTEVGSSLAKAPEPAPLSTVSLVATDDEGGPEIKGGLHWTIRDAGSGETVHEANDAGPLRLEIAPGMKTVEVYRLSDGASASATFNPTETLALSLPIIVDYAATLDAPAVAQAGATIQVAWEGPGLEQDYISVNDPVSVSTHHSHINYTYTEKGNPLELVMPPEAGTYEIRYVKQPGFRVLAKRTITVGAVAATLEAPATAAAGETITVKWTGPDYSSDYISVNDPESVSTHHSHINYTYTEKGSPLQLDMPPKAGTYEIRYVQNQNFQVLARHTITVNEVTARLEAPATAAAGETIMVKWTGPDYSSDYISVNDPESVSTHHSHINYTYTEKGSPLQLVMPPDAGTYEIRYVQRQGFEVLARHTIRLSPVSASLSAPARGVVDSIIEVSWTGPGYDSDYISIEEPDTESTHYSYETYGRADKGSPLTLRLPKKPGTYEIRYVQRQGFRVLTRQAITVVAQ